MVKNFKKWLSVLLILSLITGSLIGSNISVVAAENQLPINYDFSTTGTDLEQEIITEKFPGRTVNNVLEPNDSNATIENGELKITFDYTEAGVDYNQTSYNFRVKIPYSGLQEDENLRVSFDTRDNDGNFNAKWQQFGTLVNSNGNMVLWGRRDTDNGNRWNSMLGGLNQIMLIGYNAKASVYDKTAKPGSASGWLDSVQGGDVNTNYATKGAWAGGTIAGTEKHTICYEIERETDLVTVYVDNQVKGNFYILNELTESGYIDFRGWSNVLANETQYIDNVKIEAYKPVTTEIPINYDFSTTGTDLTTTVVVEKGAGGRLDDPNDGSVNIHDGELKMSFDSHPQSTAHNQTLYALRVKIPYSGLKDGENLRISFKTRDNDGTFGVKWVNFGSLVNENGKTVLWSRRDGYQEDGISNRYGSPYGGMAQIMLVGFKEKAVSYDTTATNGNVGGNGHNGGTVDANNGALAGYAGKTIKDTSTHTICYEIERETDLVTAYVDGEIIGTFYIMNELTENGHIDFRGWASTVADTQYLDDVKIETYVKEKPYVPKTDIPFNYDFTENIPTMGTDESNEFIKSFGGSRNGYPVTSTTTITEGAIKFEINDSKDDSVTDKNGINLFNYASGLKIPYTGLQDGENLKVSFKFKDSDGIFNAKWSDFGSLVNSDGKLVMWSRRDGATAGRFDSAWGANNQVLLVGYKTKVNTYDTSAIPSTLAANSPSKAPDIENNYASVGAFAGGNVADSQWHTLSYEIDRATEAIVVKLDGKIVGSTIYAINEVTDSGYLWFKAWSGNGNDDEQWIDDIIVETWDPLVVKETNLTSTDYDANTDITLTFSNNLASTGAEIKSAITIKEKVSGKVVENNRIKVNVENNVATIHIDGGLKYGKTAYELNVAKDRIKDVSEIFMAEEYVKEFVTKLGESVYIKNYTTPVETTASIATNVTVKNPTSVSQKVWLLLAVYDSTNNMIGLNTARELNMERGAEITFPLNATYEGTANVVQLLLWNDPDELVPYHIPIGVK